MATNGDGGGFWSRSKRVLPKRPELTVDTVKRAIEQGFAAGKYEVYPTKLVGADLVIKKSGWSGIAVKIKQDNDKTTLLYNPMSPSAGVRMLGMGLIPLLIIYHKSWKHMIREFQEFLDRTPMFQK
ncbi:MAG: hypothetical protein GYA21_09300 [Myxococcales bacterium]|nr:hypothetical protein [Myxococcales bacterium]